MLRSTRAASLLWQGRASTSSTPRLDSVTSSTRFVSGSGGVSAGQAARVSAAREGINYRYKGLSAPTANRPAIRHVSTSASRKSQLLASSASKVTDSAPGQAPTDGNEIEHAVISTFDLFSVGIGPSSSHTVGPMRAGVIFVTDLWDLGLLEKVHTIKVALYGSLALTGAGHMTPEALLGGLEGDDCETVDPPSVPARFEQIKATKKLFLGKNLSKTLKRKADAKPLAGKEIAFDYEKDVKWNFGQVLPHHSNGLRLSVFDEQGEMLATNDYYSVGGGFVVNGALATSAPTAAPLHAIGESDASANVLKNDIDEVSAHPVDWGENIFYKQLRRKDAEDVRRSGSLTHDGLLPQVAASAPSLPDVAASSKEAGVPVGKPGQSDAAVEKLTQRATSGPPFPFHNAASLLRQCRTRNLTIAQLVYENELTWHPPETVTDKLFKIWSVMDTCIRAGVESSEKALPGPLAVRRRAPALYSRLMRGVYRGSALPDSGLGATAGALGGGNDSNEDFARRSVGATSDLFDPSRPNQLSAQGRKRIIGSMNHPVMPCPPKRTNFPAIDYLSCYAIATNEQNAAGGRIVTAPTNGAAGVLPSVLKYCFEFIFDDDPGRDVQNFLLTAAAIGMLFKRGATLSAAEGGCMAEVGVATAMAAAGFVAVLGGSPEKILQASVIGIEHNLGLTCDPLNGQVQIPCIERNALGAVKAVTAAQLALAGDGQHSVSLDDAITAMRETARDMHTSYKETSLGGLATAVKIPVTVPDLAALTHRPTTHAARTTNGGSMSEVSSPAAKSDFPSTRTQHSRRESYQEQLSPSSASSGSRRRSEQLPGRYDASAGRRAEYADRPGGNHPQRQDRPDHEQTQKKPPQTQQHQQQQQQQQFRPPLQTSASVQSSATTHDGNDEPGSERAQSGSDDKRPPKRPREQYSCVECFRRKQKCDRRFPCNNCIKRRLPERCVPPASARASLSGGTPAPDAIVAPDKPEGRSPTGPRPIKKAKREANDWDNRRIEDLARTTSRIARLERILALQDPTYVEQRLALAEKAIRAHFGGGASPRASTSYRARAGHSRSSSYTHDDIDQERPGDAHIDDYEGFLGTSALDAVRIAPQLQDDNGKSPAGRSPQELLSFIQPSATRRGFPIPSADVHAIRATLPSREQCDRYFDAFFANYNWSRSPIVGNTVRERYRQLFSSVPTPSAIRVDVETLPLVALILSALTLGSVPPAVQPLTSATSHAFFWATKKALVLCETLGLASLDSCWAHGILVRYLDVIRVTRASWHEIGSWIRDALDLGLHRDGSSFRLPKEQVAARRILWWHVLHNDREWSILLGRPLTITFHTTEMPTREDLEPLGFACQTYLLARNRFTACLEAITHCFQERSAPTTSQGGRATRSGSYFKVLEVDDQIAEFVDSLPPYLSPNSTSSGKPKVDTSLDDHHPLLPYYRHLINSEVCFYRSLLHRPYLLRPAVNGKHPFPESRRICVESALNDLRARKEYGAKLTKEETAQAFGGAYAMFNSAIVVGLSLLTAFGLGEKIQHSDLTDRLGYLQDYITQLRRNFEAGNVDAAAERERMVMEILLSRLDAVLPEDAVKSSLGELAAVAAQSSTSIPASFAHTRSFSGHLHSTGPVADTRPDEQQALDSLRMLAGNLPASEDPTVLLGSAGPSIEAARYASQPNGGGGIRSMLAAPIFPSQSDWNGPGLTTIGLGAGGAPTNRIDPYGWLLTPSAVAAQDEHLSSGTARSTPSRADSAAEGGLGGGGGGSGSRSGVVGSSTLGSGGHDPSSSTGYGTGASTPSHAMHQRTASADGILQPAHLLLANGEQDPHFDWEAILQTIGSGWMGDVMAGADGPSR